MGRFLTDVGTRSPMIIDERLTSQAAQVVEATTDELGLRVTVDLPGGRRVTLPLELSDFVLSIVGGVSRGHGVTIRSMPAELTTSVAAAELGISRPTLMKAVNAGELPSHKVGSHTRIKRDDIVEYKAIREARVNAAVDTILELDQSEREG